MSKSYVATRDGFVLGRAYKAGDPVDVTELQAKYLAAPFGDDLAEEKGKKPRKVAGTKGVADGNGD